MHVHNAHFDFKVKKFHQYIFLQSYTSWLFYFRSTFATHQDVKMQQNVWTMATHSPVRVTQDTWVSIAVAFNYYSLNINVYCHLFWAIFLFPVLKVFLCYEGKTWRTSCKLLLDACGHLQEALSYFALTQGMNYLNT